MKRRSVALVLGGLAAAAAALTYAGFRFDMQAHIQRLSGGSQAITTRFGQLEYAVAGDGPPFLMIHGTGGGYDQGLTFTDKLRGFRIIAPSRFGYLASDYPLDPSSERQADAIVELLNHLGIAKLPVAGGSAGALSAIQFALRHPERTTALILIVPAANVRNRDPVEMSAAAQFMVRQLARSDFLFWAGLKARRKQMIGTLLATNPALVEQASPSEQRRANRILEEILPVSRRSRGMLNDARLAGNPARVDFTKIEIPTLVISVEDDRFGTADTARDIAAAVKGAKLVIYPRGGHIWIGHDADLWLEVARFVRSTERAAFGNQ